MRKIDLEPDRVSTLEQKIAKSKEIFEMAFERFDSKDTRIIWSGGKDSTLTLWICLRFCEESKRPYPKVFTIDEGDSFAEIDDMLNSYSKKWNIELHWGKNDDVLAAAGHQLNSDVVVADLNERNQKEIQRIGFDLDRFPFEAESVKLLSQIASNSLTSSPTVIFVISAILADRPLCASITLTIGFNSINFFKYFLRYSGVTPTCL